MNNKKEGRKLGREPKQRAALFNGLIASLIINEKIETTEAKAKSIKPKMDKIITKVKKAQGDDQKKVSVIRALRRDLNEESVSKISGEFIENFSKRDSGYTRIIKLPRRKSDSAKMAVIEFV
jgi:large subunit ribosomal protein L17